MTTRRAIRGVLHNFLGTFTSRYSDYEGFWLLGFLVSDLDRRSIDLLGAERADPAGSPWSVASKLARARFREQAQQHGVLLESIRLAELDVEKLPGDATALINSETWQGCNVRFRARAAMDNGHSYERELRVFVAPHSRRELRSTRWDGARSRPA